MKYIKHIRLINFKRFQQYDISCNPEINLFIGDNEAGKSSIMLAIDLVLSGSRSKVESCGLESLLNAKVVTKFLNGAKKIEDLPTLRVEVYLNEQSNFEMNGKINSLDRVSDGLCLVCEPDLQLSREIADVLKQDAPNFPFEFYKISFKTFSGEGYSGYSRYLRHIFIDSSQINNEYAMREYIRSVYHINAKGSEKHIHQNEYRKHKDHFKTNILSDLNGRLDTYAFAIKSNSKANLETDLTLTEDEITIDNKGKGRQCFIKTEFALSKGSEKADIVIIEEPENHLSHHHMKLLISRISEAKQIQLFVTTHNTLISTRLDLRKSILIHGNGTKPLLLKDLPEPTARFFIKAPDNNIVEYILSQKVILVEGDAEYILMEAFYKEVTGQELNSSGIHVISVGGISFKRYLDIALILGIKTAVVRDNDGDHTANCVTNYDLYQQPHINIFADLNNANSTFEKSVYTCNQKICDELFSSGLKSLTVIQHMLCHKSDVAFKLLDKKSNEIKTPAYIKEAIEWIKK